MFRSDTSMTFDAHVPRNAADCYCASIGLEVLRTDFLQVFAMQKKWLHFVKHSAEEFIAVEQRNHKYVFCCDDVVDGRLLILLLEFGRF